MQSSTLDNLEVATKTLARKEEAIRISNAKIVELDSTIEEKKRTLKSLEKQYDDRKAAIENSEGALVKEVRENLQREIRQLERSRDSFVTKIADLGRQVDDWSDKIIVAKRELRGIGEKREELRKAIRDLLFQQKEFAAMTKSTKRALVAVQKDVREKQAQADKLGKALYDLQKLIDYKAEELEQVRKALASKGDLIGKLTEKELRLRDNWAYVQHIAKKCNILIRDIDYGTGNNHNTSDGK